jgi:exosortase/archaeosortase family protein
MKPTNSHGNFFSNTILFLKNDYLSKKPIYNFLLKAASVYLVWHLFWFFWIKPNGNLDRLLNNSTAYTSVKLMNNFSDYSFFYREESSKINKDEEELKEEISDPSNQTVASVYTNFYHGHLVEINNGCNGLILMVLFFTFMVAFPGPWKKKLWYIPVGIFVIYLINCLRVIALTTNKMIQGLVNGEELFKKSPIWQKIMDNSVDFNHKGTFLIIVYGAIFYLWMIWVNRFSGISFGKKKQNHA